MFPWYLICIKIIETRTRANSKYVRFLWKISYDTYLRNETFRNSSRQTICNLIIFQNRDDNVIDIISIQRWNRRLRQLKTNLLRYPSLKIISWHVNKIYLFKRKTKTHENINILRRSSCWLKYGSSFSLRDMDSVFSLHIIWKYFSKLSDREMTFLW